MRGLAATLNVGKPAITRALDTLSRLGFVQRRRDPKDGRNVFVERTEKGDLFLEQLGDIHSAETQITEALPKMIQATSDDELKDALSTHLQETRGQIERLFTILYPNKNLQEREINVSYFLARYGYGLIDRLYEEIEPGAPDHKLVYL